MKAVAVHDWLYTYVGSERVLAAMVRCCPVSAIYTTVDFLPPEQRHFLRGLPVYHSFLQHLPGARRWRRYYLPLMPLAMESFDVSEADVVISSSSAVAKGILTHAGQLHICYCHTPARYVWDLSHQYLRAAGLDTGLKSFLVRLGLHYLRLWDVSNSTRVDHFVANSHFVARRLWHLYRRRSTVIYPPVEVSRFTPGGNKEDFYLTVSRLESYKRIDLMVEACRALGKKLVVVGDGPEMARLKAKAGRTIELLGSQPDAAVVDLMQRAGGFILAAQEDFGIAPVEAQACGTPVIALARGGALETVRGVYPGERPEPGTTGVFFREQTAAALAQALEHFERHRGKFDPAACRAQAERFRQEHFETAFGELVRMQWQAFQEDNFRIRQDTGEGPPGV